eukprot:TRINITY_DN3581_c0_g1_i1.p1 TRINITY_DN3581_c0_g1~~TRINITY_DN3581_c0_g1_i1.p1  ORF type:complete len:721 (+),score=79.32 TRINITY_DN3581_c0_g1_i1:141-2303(+)
MKEPQPKESFDTSNIPDFKLALFKSGSTPVGRVRGPNSWNSRGDTIELETGTQVFRARSISTFPLAPGGGRHLDPITERYAGLVYNDRSIFAVASGCKPGPAKYLQAADTAVNAFVQSLAGCQSKITTTRNALSRMRSAMKYANECINLKDNPDDVGSTTLLGVMVLPLRKESSATLSGSNNPAKWAVISLTLGNNKLFHYCVRTDKIAEISGTLSPPRSLDQIQETGGRLGSMTDILFTDLRVAVTLAEERDLLICLTSSGHLNLHPYFLGLTAKDVGLPYERWKDVPRDQHLGMEEFVQHTLRDLVNDVAPMPGPVVDRILRHQLHLTRPTRRQEASHTSRSRISPSRERPGYLGHSTCVCYLIPPVHGESYIASPMSVSYGIPFHNVNRWEWTYFFNLPNNEGGLPPFSIWDVLLQRAPALTTDLLKQRRIDQFVQHYLKLSDTELQARMYIQDDHHRYVDIKYRTHRDRTLSARTWTRVLKLQLTRDSTKHDLIQALRGGLEGVCPTLREKNIDSMLNTVDPTRHLLTLMGQSSVISLAKYGSIIGLLSGDLTIKQADFDLIGHGNKCFGKFRGIWIHGEKLAYLRDFVKYFTPDPEKDGEESYRMSLSEFLLSIYLAFPDRPSSRPSMAVLPSFSITNSPPSTPPHTPPTTPPSTPKGISPSKSRPSPRIPELFVGSDSSSNSNSGSRTMAHRLFVDNSSSSSSERPLASPRKHL